MDSTSGNPKSLLKFMMLIGKLKTTKRTGWVLKGLKDVESVADHMYRMAIIALVINKKEVGNLNLERCIKMALVHDLAECIVGDLTPYCGVPKEEKHSREKEAMTHVSGLLSKESGEELYNLWQEYEEQSSDEAKLVKDLDRFDMILQAFEYEESSKNKISLQDFFDSTEGKFQHPVILKMVKELKIQRESTFTQQL